MKRYRYPSVLTIAGFDGSGGAGIQADIKTISALGCYASSVLTALPVQNTMGVRSIYPIPVEAIPDQLQAIFEDIPPDAVKIGMVHTPDLVNAIAHTLAKYTNRPIVFDPVMVATSGHRLIEEKTIRAIIEQLFPLSTVVTPNMDEAAILAGMEVKTPEQMQTAAQRIQAMGCKTVLLKGGHLSSAQLVSFFLDNAGVFHRFESEKFSTNNTHGSGCTLSSAIASYIAQGKALTEAVELGQQYVFHAIEAGMDVQTGKGNGPLNHFFNPQKLIKLELVG